MEKLYLTHPIQFFSQHIFIHWNLKMREAKDLHGAFRLCILRNHIYH